MVPWSRGRKLLVRSPEDEGPVVEGILDIDWGSAEVKMAADVVVVVVEVGWEQAEQVVPGQPADQRSWASEGRQQAGCLRPLAFRKQLLFYCCQHLAYHSAGKEQIL